MSIHMKATEQYYDYFPVVLFCFLSFNKIMEFWNFILGARIEALK